MSDAAGALLLRGGRVLAGDSWRERCDVRISGGAIVALGERLPESDARVIDAAGLEVVPGFVDLHVHGAGGAMFEDGESEGVRQIRTTLAAHGTTSLLATIAALPPADLERAVAAIAEAPADDGARLLGIHLEGPFLNPHRAGAQRADWMRDPSTDELDRLQALAHGTIRLVTVAPELPGALPFIRHARRCGIAVALGHSEASAEVVEAAIDAGATQVTHLFNAMAPLHHREVGLAGVALTDDRLAVELIADGVHVDRRALALAVGSKAPGRWLLVSDGVAAVGQAAGPLRLFGADCVVGNAVRLASDGRLAGSCLTLATAVRNLRTWLPSLPAALALGAATRHPAAAIGRAADCGQLAVGRSADIVCLEREGRAQLSMVAGRVLHP